MNKKYKGRLVISILFILLFGSVLHFIYVWSGKNPFIAAIGAVNESVWEHLKLFFWPAFILFILEYFTWGKTHKNYVFSKAVSLYCGILLIIALFYTYSGILGTHYLLVDLLIFVISTIISQIIGYKLLSETPSRNKRWKTNLSFIAILLLVAAFVLFTYYPPNLPLFTDPSSLK